MNNFRTLQERPPGIKLVLLLVYISFVMALMRAIDLVVLLRWPRLLRAYLTTWRSAYTKSPFSERSFEKVHQARRRGRSQVELTYGETPVITARGVLRRAGVTRESQVIDLGMGRGRVLIAARTLGASARGYDLLEAHVELTTEPLAAVDVVVRCEDAAKVDLSEATHIFLAWTCFTERSRREVTAHLTTMKPGAVIVTLDYPVDDEGFELMDERAIWCSWGRASAFTSRRRP